MSKIVWRSLALILLAVAVAAVVRELLAPPPMPRERIVGREGMRQPRATPEEERIDPAALRAAADYAATQDTRALIVSRHGHIVFEQYWNGAGYDTLMDAGTFNRAIAALTVGMTLDDRKIGSIDEPLAGDFAAPRGITIRRLLESTDVQALVPLIERATGQRYAEYVSRRLWQPLAAGDAFIGLDKPGGTARADCCFFARASDWIRIAQLFLSDGQYQGEQIAPPGWVGQMLAPSRANPAMGMQFRRGMPRHGFHLSSDAGNRLWLMPTLGLAVLRFGEEPRNWDESRIPELVMAGVRDPKPAVATDLSTLVPDH